MMQEEMGRIQEELAETDYTVKVGGGAVELVMTGKPGESLRSRS